MSTYFGIRLPPEVAERLARGAPSVGIEDLGSPDGLVAGRPVRLLDDHGETVAEGIADPANGVVHVLSLEPVSAFDAGFFRRRLAGALALRRALGLVDGISAWRLVNGEGDALPGFVADVYGEHAVVGVPSRGLLAAGRLLAEVVLAEPTLGLRGVVIKVRGKDPSDRSLKDEILGEAPPERLVTHELSVPYEVHLCGSRNVGLFTDMREARRSLPAYAAGRRVLNTFAYTGAFSVTAARAGAAAVVSVDLSTGVLAWTRDNFRLSGLDPEDPRYRFEASDVRKYLSRCREERRTFELILLDPPTVSAARSAAFVMKRDYPELIALAADCLPEAGGVLQVSANARSGTSVLSHVVAGLERAGRRGSVLEVLGLPPDYPTPAGWPASRYLEIYRVFAGER